MEMDEEIEFLLNDSPPLDIEFILEDVPPVPKKPKIRGKSRNTFNKEEKKKLALLVQEHPSIWCLEDKGHINLDKVNADWRQICIQLNKKVDDCKAAWKALRDSHRYHSHSRKMGKSGSAAEENPLDDEEHLDDDGTDDWEFSECLAFLQPASAKRRTYSSPMPSNLASNENLDQIDQGAGSSYSYNTPKPQKKDLMADNVSQLTQTVSDLIKLRKEERNEKPKENLENYSLLANLDRVLKKLPQETVEELGVSFQTQALQALREHQSNTTRSPN